MRPAKAAACLINIIPVLGDIWYIRIISDPPMFPTNFLRLTCLVFLIICASGLSRALAQNQKPKIGLALSGGGAKGIAHVRILQVLDSLGIVPDYITGTSMGSIVGALYASGYSAHEIDSITQSMDWKTLFSNTVTFPEINIEEKDEFGRYVYELPMNGFKPQLPLGLIEGQHIEEVLTNLFFPVNAVTDFNKLPTPFLCVASDIVKGEPVILNKGSLPTAVRASMSIPTVFAPVRIDNRLLVDGGVFVNLPVTYCREMGADFIIAVDVGGGLMQEKELTSAASFLMQTSFLASNTSYQSERQKGDIFIDVFSHLKYGTMDFEHGADMMKSGDIAVKQVMPQLVQLADRLKAYPKRKIKTISQQELIYRLDSVTLDGVSAGNKQLVLKRFGWKEGDQVNREQIGARVRSLMGTRLFDKISYAVEGDSINSSLTIRAKEKPLNAVKFAIHYDTDRGAGLILNFTKRNLMLPASRFLATVDLAENPRARLNYFYYVGKETRWWHATELYGEKIELNTFVQGTPVPDVINGYLSASTFLNYSINQRSYIGLGGFWNWSQLRPKIDPRDEAHPEPLEIINYDYQTFGARVQYQYNSFDRVYFPTSGSWLRVESSANFGNPMDAKLYVTDTDTAFSYTLDGQVQSYLRLNLRAQTNVRLSTHVTLQLRLQTGLTQEISKSADKFSAYNFAAGDFIMVGGQLNRPRSNSFIFTGLREAELSVPQIMTAGASIQINPLKNIYVIPAVNLLAAGYDSSEFWKTLDDFHFSDKDPTQSFYQVGYGLTAAYMSLLGPIQVSVSNDPQVDKVRWFLNIGFNF